MSRRIAYLFGIVLAALVQARLLPELGFERTLNLPAILLFVTASLERRTLALAAATAAGLTLDLTLLRPLGLSSLSLVAGVIVASQVRGAGDALLLRRTAALFVGLLASSAAVSVLSSGQSGLIGEGPVALGLNLLVGAALSWVGLRRRSRFQLDRSLRG